MVWSKAKDAYISAKDKVVMAQQKIEDRKRAALELRAVRAKAERKRLRTEQKHRAEIRKTEALRQELRQPQRSKGERLPSRESGDLFGSSDLFGGSDMFGSPRGKKRRGGGLFDL